VIEFTDPDCPYCRKASEYLKGKNDMTRYVYFIPMPAHKDAENKARFILCSNDKAKAYEEVMSGKYDHRKVDACSDEKVSTLLKEHRELAAKAGVTGTPSFWINGQFVVGANIPAIEGILKNQKKPQLERRSSYGILENCHADGARVIRDGVETTENSFSRSSTTEKHSFPAVFGGADRSGRSASRQRPAFVCDYRARLGQSVLRRL
jgi:glutaredoxin